jgi:hypothetical protein
MLSVNELFTYVTFIVYYCLMKMRYIGICVLMCLFTCCMAIGQNSDDMLIAAKQIVDLKDGTLLIKLNTQSARINNRLKLGQKKKAEELINEVEKEHDEIINAFKKHYTFSDYYFFYSDDSDSVLIKKNYKSLFKVNTGDTDITHNIKGPFVLMLGIPPGYSSIDKYKFLLHSLGDNGIEPVSKSLPKVFATRTNKLFSNKYDFDRSVIKIQERMNDFYNQSHSDR